MLWANSSNLQRRIGLLAILALGAGCTDFATPAALATPTMIAITSEPPVVPPGTTARLELVVASAGGRVPVAPAWSLEPTYAGAPVLGRLAPRDDGGVDYIAPATVQALPANAKPVDTLVARSTVDGQPMVARKAVVVANVKMVNPQIQTLTVDNREVGASGDEVVTLKVGSEVGLAVSVVPELSDAGAVAWYASVGTIEQYTSNPTTLVADKAGEGWLFVVVRDGQLGVVWRSVRLAVQE